MLLNHSIAWGMVAAALLNGQVLAVTVDFDDLTLARESFWHGPDPDGQIVPGQFVDEVHGTFESHGIAFVNRYTPDFGSWTGFAYSNQTDTTNGNIIQNQHSAIAGSGHGTGDDNYGVAYGYHDLQANNYQPVPFNPANQDHLDALPYLEIPTGLAARSMWVTNTTPTALLLQNGDPNAFSKQFGGVSGGDPDWMLLSAYGTDSSGQLLPEVVEFYLGDYRFSDPANDYLVTDWRQVDLTPLAGAAKLYFNISSSDTGLYGMNTPAYFAVDDIDLALPGDYNGDLRVDAADYAVWRNALDTSVAFPGQGADGDFSGFVDQGDYLVWRNAYGRGVGAAAFNTATAPEPSALLLALLILTALSAVRLTLRPGLLPRSLFSPS